MRLFTKFHKTLIWLSQSIVYASRMAGDVRTFFELIFIMTLAYTDRRKTALRRRLCSMAGLFLQSPKRNEVCLSLRMNTKIHRLWFPNRSGMEFWTIRSILIEILIKKTYHLKFYSNSPECIVDAGANLGLATLYFYSLYPSARFFCYEPSSETFRFLKRNLEANKVPHVAFQKALADYNGRAAFLTTRSSMERQLDSLSSTPAATADCSETVEVATLQSEFRSLGIGTVDLLKFDVEGAEAALLRGLGDDLRHVRALVGEVHSAALAEETASILRAHDFDVTRSDDHLHAMRKTIPTPEHQPYAL